MKILEVEFEEEMVNQKLNIQHPNIMNNSRDMNKIKDEKLASAYNEKNEKILPLIKNKKTVNQNVV